MLGRSEMAIRVGAGRAKAGRANPASKAKIIAIWRIRFLPFIDPPKEIDQLLDLGRQRGVELKALAGAWVSE